MEENNTEKIQDINVQTDVQTDVQTKVQEESNTVYESKEMNVYNKNVLTVIGKIINNPTLSHETHGEKIYTFQIEIPRLNKDVKDILNVEVSDRAVDINSIHENDTVKINGQFRSFNRYNKEKGKVSLELFIFAKDIVKIENDEEINNINKIELHGNLCKVPVFRHTPSGREISDLLVAVQRQYNRSDYIPCIAWSRNARYATKNLTVGTPVVIEGRVQSRNYIKHLDNGEEEKHTVYEVSCMRLDKDEKGIEKSDKSEKSETKE